MSEVRDVFGRPLHDLRISVTDRCNFRCPYCMPREVFGEAHRFLPKAEILSFEEIARVVTLMCRLGVRKLRLTGGEPLLRRELPELIRRLACVELVEDLALTTNGLLLAPVAQALKGAGLHRVTVSLDALDDELFRRLSGADRPVGDVLGGIRAASRAGLPLKINSVIQRGVNEDQILPLAQWCRDEGYTLRFIEYMDVGNHNHWHAASVVPGAEILARLSDIHPLVAVGASVPGEVARRYRYMDGAGEVGLVSSVSRPFCRDCNRARLTADGQFVTCLFAEKGADLRTLLRTGASDGEVSQFVINLWRRREDRYSESRATAGPRRKIEMSYVGG